MMRYKNVKRHFRKALPQNPRLARGNLSVTLKMMSLSGM